MRELKSRALSGKSQARGRNGWFVPAEIMVWATERYAGEAIHRPVVVEMSSKQRGNLAPILMHLTVEDAKNLVGAITNAIVDAGGFQREAAK